MHFSRGGIPKKGNQNDNSREGKANAIQSQAVSVNRVSAGRNHRNEPNRALVSVDRMRADGILGALVAFACVAALALAGAWVAVKEAVRLAMPWLIWMDGLR